MPAEVTGEPVVGLPEHLVDDLALAADQVADEHAEAGPDAWRDATLLLALDRAVRTGDDDRVEALAAGYDALLTRHPVRRGDQVRLVPAGNAERRRRGAFATPSHLAAVLARHALPGTGAPAADRVPRVVDPSCGAGALLVAALDRLVGLGHHPDAAVRRLHGVDADPVAVALCRARLRVRARRLGAGADAAPRLHVGDALLGPVAGPSSGGAAAPVDDDPPVTAEGAVVWHRAFREVLDVAAVEPAPVTGWRGGFDAVLANPPWERLKVFRREGVGPALEALRDKRFEDSRAVRTAGRHPLTGAGEVNAYLPFVETCWRLLAAEGRAGLLVPAGIASDRSAAPLVRALLAAGALEALHLLRPDRLFDGVSARVAPAVVVLTGPPHLPRPGVRAEVAVDVADAARPAPAARWRLDADLPRLVNPNTATLQLCSSGRDADLLAAAHRRWPVLVRRAADGTVTDDPWQVRLVTPLHMTRDAGQFRDGPGPGLLPLWEAKHAGLLDPHGGSRRTPRYWVPEEVVHRRWGDLVGRGWLGGYRNVTTATAPRTLLPTPLPPVAVGNSLPLVQAPRLPLLLTVLAALPVDYLVRQKHAGANLNFFKLEQVALPAPSDYDAPAPWQPGRSLEQWLLQRLAEAVPDLEALPGLAAELRAAGVEPEPGGRGDRDRALAEIDAAHALLLGWDREDLAHVLSTFPALAERDHRRYGRPRTAELVLAAYHRLAG